MGLRFLHCSDIHLLHLRRIDMYRYFNKRLTGAANLLLKRRKLHDSRLFDRIVETSIKLGVQRFVITGDLTNLAFESEFEHVRDRLRELPMPVTLIPGNHDAYTRRSEQQKRCELILREFMTDAHVGGGLEYPFVTRHRNVAFVGLSSAIATPPFSAVGQVGSLQLQRMGERLHELSKKDVLRVVLIHHPVVDGVAKSHHELLDRKAFSDVLARFGAELILHGHEHKTMQSELLGPNGRVPVHGIASGTSRSMKLKKRAAFSIYDTEGSHFCRILFRWNGETFEASNDGFGDR